MNLFRKRPTAADVVRTVVVPPKAVEISMSVEQEALLHDPVDPRVEKILKDAADKKLKSTPLTSKPDGNSGEKPITLLDAL